VILLARAKGITRFGGFFDLKDTAHFDKQQVVFQRVVGFFPMKKS
jgi:hypothetical protein